MSDTEIFDPDRVWGKGGWVTHPCPFRGGALVTHSIFFHDLPRPEPAAWHYLDATGHDPSPDPLSEPERLRYIAQAAEMGAEVERLRGELAKAEGRLHDYLDDNSRLPATSEALGYARPMNTYDEATQDAAAEALWAGGRGCAAWDAC